MLLTEAAGRPTEIAKEAANLARKVLGGQIEVIWFGSWPKGRAQAHSGIDLAVRADGSIPPERIAVLRDEVEEIPTLYEVDLLDLSYVSPSLRDHILENGERL